jgi:sucrose-phosphate synthase
MANQKKHAKPKSRENQAPPHPQWEGESEEQSRRYLMLFSVHGLVRGENMELGRDADTGGQVQYVVELARALGQHPEVERVDLVTRLIRDGKVDDSYAEPIEEIGENARIVRIPFGPNRYLAKESLWPHLDALVDNTIQYMRSQGRAPDLFHGHYADAGYVAARLSGLFDIPMVFTGHSLGRVKRQRLLDQGKDTESIEKRYRITRRIEAEETALDHAAFIVTSTHQEVEQQYSMYDHYSTQRMMVIPPAVNLERFNPPPERFEPEPVIHQEVKRFLADPTKPMILAIARADHRKNLSMLVKAYGESKELQEAANLVLVAGNRDDIPKMERGPRVILLEILLMMDRYDLYGKMAFPKHHDSADVPLLYQLATTTQGVFVNPALTEPFGLTLLEAAASGLPIVATNDGGPRDIVGYCENGVLIDPFDQEDITRKLLDAVTNKKQWAQWSESGITGCTEHFSWSAHVDKYLRVGRTAITQSPPHLKFYNGHQRLVTADRIVVSDIDNTLIGDVDGLRKLMEMLQQAGDKVAFGIATGRSLDLTLEVLKEWDIPMPQLLVTSVGSEIHYGPHLIHDEGWEWRIGHRWKPDAIREAMAELPGLTLQPPEGQGRYKISYLVDTPTTGVEAPSARDIIRHLRRASLSAKVIYSHSAYIDLLPIRASKGMALRYFLMKWGIPMQRCLVAGDSGNDEEMLSGNTPAIVVGNYDPELEKLRENPDIYFAEGHYSWGIIEGIEHYDFLGEIVIPNELEASWNA